VAAFELSAERRITRERAWVHARAGGHCCATKAREPADTSNRHDNLS
jgi:hypothetical protein